MKPGSSTAQSLIDRVLAEQGGHKPAWNGQFSNSRYAFLFEEGSHNVSMELGYYTTVHGLGRTPSATHLDALTVQNGDFDTSAGCLNNFWRGAENVQTKPANGIMTWAVSQASPLRRVQVDGDIFLFEGGGYASGGYMSEMQISGKVITGSQQQWFSRNSEMGSGEGSVWNNVWVGVPEAP